LKNTVGDLYSVEDIVKAKTQLLRDIDSLNLPERAPHENRQVRETDDIFVFITFKTKTSVWI